MTAWRALLAPLGMMCLGDNSPMIVESNAPLQPHNTFGIVAKARALVRVRSAADVHAVLAGAQPGFVKGLAGPGGDLG